MLNPFKKSWNTDFDVLPDRPLRSVDYWVGRLLAGPLCFALAAAYLVVAGLE